METAGGGPERSRRTGGPHGDVTQRGAGARRDPAGGRPVNAPPGRGPMPTDVFVRRVGIAAVLAVLAALTVLYTRLLANTLLVIFAGILFAVLLHGCARVLRGWVPIPRRAAVLATVLLGLLLLAAFGWWMGPRVADQMSGLPGRLAEVVGDLRESLERSGAGRAVIDRFGEGLGATPGMVGGVMGAFTTVAGAATSAFIILFLGLFVAWNPGIYVRPLLLLLPKEDARSRAREVLDAVVGALESWLAARFASMAVVGSLTVAALLLAGVPMALALGVIAGLLSFVPFVGPITAAVPAALVGLGEGPRTALVVVAIYVAVQAVESNAITPIIEHRVASVPPAAVLAAQTVMGLLFGVVGVLVATPVALTVVVLVQTIYLEDRLGEDVEPAGA